MMDIYNESEIHLLEYDMQKCSSLVLTLILTFLSLKKYLKPLTVEASSLECPSAPIFLSFQCLLVYFL